MAGLTLTGLSKVYADGTRAVDGVTLDIADGEFMVLVGPSGCGKSTLLRLVAGLEEASSGEILIGGDRVGGWSPQRRNVAMVFQNYALYPHMTVRRNLEFPLRRRRLDRVQIARRVAEVAALLGLTELLERRPKQLSGGQRQRVAMGRAMVRDPSVFLMDEPLSNLDARLRVQIRTEIAELQRRLKATTVYVTHDQTEAMTLGERVAVLHAGRLRQVDVPQGLYARPANTFVAGFIGSPGMNLIAGRLAAGRDGPAVLVGGVEFPLGRGERVSGRQLNEYADGSPVCIGIRPEALRVVAPADAMLILPVRSVETLGHEKLVFMSVGRSESRAVAPRAACDHDALSGQLAAQPDAQTEQGRSTVLVGRVPAPTPVAAGDLLPLAVAPEQIFLFDAAGEALQWGSCSPGPWQR